MTCGTKGGFVSGWKQSMKTVSNNEWREVSRGHSTIMVANIVGRIQLRPMVSIVRWNLKEGGGKSLV